MEFRNRRDAGRRLAPQLLPLAHEDPVVLALPRGGVPVAFEVACSLGAPLDILAVRKLGAPADPEFAVGALAEDGTSVLDAETVRRVGMTRSALEHTLERELREVRRRAERYRAGTHHVAVRGRTVIVIDDGLATGLTCLVAVRALRSRGAARVVVAVPVAAAAAIGRLGTEADEVVAHTIPRELIGVGRWYHDFAEVSDDEVLALLYVAAQRQGAQQRREGECSAAHDPGEHRHAAPRQRCANAPREVALAGSRELTFEFAGASLIGDLTVPALPAGLVIFAHGSGSSRLSPRNREVASVLNDSGLATLLFDLLSAAEGRRGELVFDIPLLAHRLEFVTREMLADPAVGGLPLGYFGASTGAAAALRAAAAIGSDVRSVVSRGGRPDLVDGRRLAAVTASTLLLVGSHDSAILSLNREAAELLTAEHAFTVINGAGHLFEEAGTLDVVARLAAQWFTTHLAAPAARPLALA